MASVVTKADLVEAAAKAGNLTKSAAGEAVNAIFDSIVNSVAKGNRVTVVGFGTSMPLIAPYSAWRAEYTPAGG